MVRARPSLPRLWCRGFAASTVHPDPEPRAAQRETCARPPTDARQNHDWRPVSDTGILTGSRTPTPTPTRAAIVAPAQSWHVRPSNVSQAGKQRRLTDGHGIAGNAAVQAHYHHDIAVAASGIASASAQPQP